MAEKVSQSTSADKREDHMMCQLCGTLEHLSLCAGCRETWYCCKEHQKADWTKHKGACKKSSKENKKGSQNTDKIMNNNKSVINNGTQSNSVNSAEKISLKTTSEKSHENQSRDKSEKNKNVKAETSQSTASKDKSEKNKNGHVNAETSQVVNNNAETYVTVLKSRFDMYAKYVVYCLSKYGICVIDNFLGDSKGTEILEEVVKLRQSGVFTEGQLVNSASNTQNIRGDILTWVDGREIGCQNIHFLISCMDDIIQRCAGKLENYVVNERSRAMVACYPGNNTGYVKHVDNPNGDGRCVTCIYYLNKDWDVTKYGGMLRICPEDQDQVANIEPLFDRLLFFWSDRRNPHEVRASNKERYAITVWYYDEEERKLALQNSKDHYGRNPRRLAVPLISRK